jgi:hypothetical protein
MNMNPNAIFSRIEIFFYSILISCMSAVNRIRAHIDHSETIPVQGTPDELNSSKIIEETPERSLNFNLIYIWQSLIPLMIWMILGFAAGFLIGMINPR